MSKSILLNDLYNEYMNTFSGLEIVLGDGDPDARLLLIGEAPGKDEVKQGKPFVGTAGKNLSEFLQILGLNRESIFITNAIKHRLSRINEKTGRLVNRPATRDEIERNRMFLIREIELINPTWIVTLGNVPLRSVNGSRGLKIGDVHGRLIETVVGEQAVKLFPLYHPASIIYNQSLIKVYKEDLEALKDIIIYN